MNFVKDKTVRMAFFGLIITSVATIHNVRANHGADSKHNCKEYPASRENGNKSQPFVIDSIIEFNDTELERGNLYMESYCPC